MGQLTHTHEVGFLVSAFLDLRNLTKNPRRTHRKPFFRKSIKIVKLQQNSKKFEKLFSIT